MALEEHASERFRRLILAYCEIRNIDRRVDLVDLLDAVCEKHDITGVSVTKQKISSQLTGYRPIGARDVQMYTKALGIPEAIVGGALVATRRLAPGVPVTTPKGGGG